MTTAPPSFATFIGIDYSGEETSTRSTKVPYANLAGTDALMALWDRLR